MDGWVKEQNNDNRGILSGDAIYQNFVESYVDLIFDNPSASLSSKQKSLFGCIIQDASERQKFCKCISVKRQMPLVNEDTLLSLQQHFSLVLFECHKAEDFTTALSLMNMSFTFYFTDSSGQQVYPHMFLKEQPIFHDNRFWNAAFFDSLNKLRSAKPLIPIGLGTSPETLRHEQSFLENITFGQLGNFLCYMQALGLPFQMARSFLDKQSTIAGLPAEQLQCLVEYLDRVYQTE